MGKRVWKGSSYITNLFEDFAMPPTSAIFLRKKLTAACLLGILGLGPLGQASATTYEFRTLLAGNPLASSCNPGSITETVPNASLQIPVAAKGCRTIRVTLKGAAGGDGGDGGIGGAGGEITFSLPAAAYAGTWAGVVGQGGQGPGGGTYSGGNGGGYSSVSYNGVLLGVAGGGGGAGDAANAGDGGMPGSYGASSPGCPTGGGGGTDSAGGSPGTICGGYNSGQTGAAAGSVLTGGDAEAATGPQGIGNGGWGDQSPNWAGSSGNGGAGGGGGGYYGGGGGTSGGDYQTGGGGGGGSDYAISTASGVTDTVGGGSPAGTGNGATGNNGSITISWQ
jgi:hypothetical protein